LLSSFAFILKHLLYDFGLLLDFIVEQRSQGNFVRDILVEAIGRPEHYGRVSATRKGVEIKLYFGVAPLHNHNVQSTSEIG